jgi:hypothetical protein
VTLKDRIAKLRRDNPLFTVAMLTEITLYGDSQERDQDFLAAAAQVLKCSQAEVDEAVAFTGEARPFPACAGEHISQFNSGEPFTIADLKREIADLPDSMWVCVEATPGGPMRALLVERNAMEHFCLIETGEPKQN